MHTPSVKLLTPGQWLARSFGLTISCLGGWLLLSSLLLVSLQRVSSQYDTLVWMLIPGSALIIHLLLWWKAFAGVWSWSPEPDEWLLEVVVRAWVAVLMLFQSISLLSLIGALGLAFG